jgi:hypothetical protein
MVFPLIFSFIFSYFLFFGLYRYDFSFFSTYLNLFRSVKTQANKLYDETLKLNKFSLSSGENIKLTEYKFFTSLVEELLKFYRNFGVSIFDDLSNVRLALQKDWVQSHKVQTLIKGALLEILIIVLMSWGIIFFAIYYTGLVIKNTDLFIVGALQIGGLILLISLIEKSYKKIFSSFYPYLKSVYSLQVFIKSRTPVNEIGVRVGINSLPHDKDLLHIKERVELCLKNLSEYGKIDITLLNDLIGQVWTSFEMKTQKFNTHVLKQKIFVIMSVVVPSYLYIFYALLKSLTL